MDRSDPAEEDLVSTDWIFRMRRAPAGPRCVFVKGWRGHVFCRRVKARLSSDLVRLGAVATLLVATVGCRAKKDPGASSGASVAPEATDATPAALAAAKEAGPAAPACTALEAAKITPFATCTTKVVKSPVPNIVDDAQRLAPFWETLALHERGAATKPLRIGVYGDSNLTSDFISGHLRRVLQDRYGDAGHGYISLSRPWGSYRHEDVVMAGLWPMFKQWAPTTHVAPDKQYGFANMAAESNDTGDAQLTLTFEAGTDPDIAQVQVQNKLQLALPLLPEEVAQQGVRVAKVAQSYLMVLALVSPDETLTQTDIGDFAAARLVEPLGRVSGVGDVLLFAEVES